jgi:hypothetical protein
MISALSILASVDLPEPFLPKIAMYLPLAIDKEIPETAFVVSGCVLYE